jgi:hypothetical protein
VNLVYPVLKVFQAILVHLVHTDNQAKLDFLVYLVVPVFQVVMDVLVYPAWKVKWVIGSKALPVHEVNLVCLVFLVFQARQVFVCLVHPVLVEHEANQVLLDFQVYPVSVVHLDYLDWKDHQDKVAFRVLLDLRVIAVFLAVLVYPVFLVLKELVENQVEMDKLQN